MSLHIIRLIYQSFLNSNANAWIQCSYQNGCSGRLLAKINTSWDTSYVDHVKILLISVFLEEGLTLINLAIDVGLTFIAEVVKMEDRISQCHDFTSSSLVGRLFQLHLLFNWTEVICSGGGAICKPLQLNLDSSTTPPFFLPTHESFEFLTSFYYCFLVVLEIIIDANMLRCHYRFNILKHQYFINEISSPCGFFGLALMINMIMCTFNKNFTTYMKGNFWGNPSFWKGKF